MGESGALKKLRGQDHHPARPTVNFFRKLSTVFALFGAEMKWLTAAIFIQKPKNVTCFAGRSKALNFQGKIFFAIRPPVFLLDFSRTLNSFSFLGGKAP
ncbi:MAG: hypothetical protein NTX50_10160 [Candidatus Sumerlaeota bacterium]|nr:hypothetical protein [Candidatus Sumerlaeota bacterium]